MKPEVISVKLTGMDVCGGERKPYIRAYYQIQEKKVSVMAPTDPVLVRGPLYSEEYAALLLYVHRKNLRALSKYITDRLGPCVIDPNDLYKQISEKFGTIIKKHQENE